MKGLHKIHFGTGAPLFFQHGLGAESSQVIQFLNGLKGYCTYALDCPAHGGSKHTEGFEAYSFNGFADLVVDSIANHSKNSIHVGGISMGAGISINIAVRFPQLIKSLVLVRPSWLHLKRPVHLELFYQISENVFTSGSIEKFWDDSLEDLFTRHPYLKMTAIDFVQKNQEALLQGVYLQLINDAPFNSLGELHSIQSPALLIACEHDYLHPVEVAKTIHENISGSSFYILPSRYLEPVKFQKEAVGLIQEFLDNVK